MKNHLEKEINNKHFIFKTVLRTKRDHRDLLNKKNKNSINAITKDKKCDAL